MSVGAKLRLAVRIWRWFLIVRMRVHREELPRFVAQLGRARRRRMHRHPPSRLSRAVHRSLRVGNRRPSCLVNALVLFRLLREQGDRAELVIGLPAKAADKDAHAWVEVNGLDVGPPPGRGPHTEIARFS